MFGRKTGSESKAVLNDVRVHMGRRIVDFGDGSRLKSDISLSTNLPLNLTNDIVDNVHKKLSKRQQPVLPHDIATTTHIVMIEMGLKPEGDKYLMFIKDRHDRRELPKELLKYIKCDYCGTSNDSNNTRCLSCHAVLNKNKTDSKII